MVRKGSSVRVRHWASMGPSSEDLTATRETRAEAASEATDRSSASTIEEHGPDRAGEDRSGKPGRARRMAERLHERRQRHLERSRPHRIGIVVLGFLITLLGLVMTGPIPGPGTLIIPIGLALLALEFAWAERLLERALRYAETAGERASGLSTRTKVLIGVVVVLAVCAAVAAVVVFRPPPFN
jgi:uncharacterized protein (TIGR02611 family)